MLFEYLFNNLLETFLKNVSRLISLFFVAFQENQNFYAKTTYSRCFDCKPSAPANKSVDLCKQFYIFHEKNIVLLKLMHGL